jgi:hypothetical protein
MFPNEANGVFEAIPADVVEHWVESIQGRFKVILGASVLTRPNRRATYLAFLAELRDLRRHRLEVMAVHNSCLEDYPFINGNDPTPGPSSS